MAFDSLEPFGDLAADRRHGMAVSVMANINRNSKARPEAYTPEDFTPWRAVERAPDAAELHLDPEAQSQLIKRKLFKHG